MRIRDSFDWAKKSDVSYKYVIDNETISAHPNTADMDIVCQDGTKLFVRGVSIGGGRVKITRINNIDVEFMDEYSTLIVQQ